MTSIQKKADLLLDAMIVAKRDSHESWADRFLMHVDDTDPVWKAIEALTEGYVDGFSYDGIKEVQRLWDILCQCLDVMPEDDYSDADYVEDILDSWEAHRVYP